MAPQIAATLLFVEQVVELKQITKKTSKLHITGPLSGESTSDLQTPYTEGHYSKILFISWHWASLTVLTAVSKFKPRLHVQWAIGSHRKGSQMEKVTSRMSWPIRNSTQIRN